MSEELFKGFNAAQQRYDSMEDDYYYERTVTCSDCEGEGKLLISEEDSLESGENFIPCKLCKGTGEITIDTRIIKQQRIRNQRNKYQDE